MRIMDAPALVEPGVNLRSGRRCTGFYGVGYVPYTPAAVAPVVGVLVRCAGEWLYMLPLYFCKLFPLPVGYTLTITNQGGTQ